MLSNYILTTLRNLGRNKVFSIINISGLAIGLACFIMLVLYVKNELGYDRHHPNAENIYRLTMKANMGGNDLHAAVTGGPVGDMVQNEIPGVIVHTTIYQPTRSILFRVNDRDFYQEHILYADSGFFDVFSYEFIAGDPATVLDHPGSMVLTESMVKKFFGDQDPMNQAIKWNNEDNMIVKGVIKDPEFNSFLNFDVLASLSTFRTSPRMWRAVNGLWFFATQNYVSVNASLSKERLKEKLDQVIEKHLTNDLNESGMKMEWEPQHITDIHLHSNIIHELETNGDISRVYIFSAIAILILIIACINFVNLSTSKSSKRAAEVGVRKVFGANRDMLFRQFIGESVIVAIISLIIAVILVEIFLPFFNEISGIEFGREWHSDWQFALFVFTITLVVGFVSGIYPAMFLSSFKPIKVLKGNLFTGTAKPLFRNSMVVLQFAISVFLIFSTIVIYQQMDFLEKKDIGIDKEHVVVISVRDPVFINKYDNIQEEIRLIPGVKDVSASSTYLGRFEQRRSYYPEGVTRQDSWMMNNVQVDYNFLEMMGTELVMGRQFNPNRQLDSNAIIINKAMMKKLGWEDPLGRNIFLPIGDSATPDYRLKIIGVVKDFNFASLHQPVVPLLINMDPARFRYLNVKIDHHNIPAILAMLEEKWQAVSPNHPFDYFFLDTKFNSFYVAESQMSTLFIYFSVLAVFIAAMGLFGLTLYTTERRTREIGIRKVFGGSVKQILNLLLREFIQWVIVANLIAWPVAWYFMDGWLNNFAYQTHIAWWIFLLSAIVSLIIALVTVTWQSIRSALQNPVDSLRYE
nr:ABC transporter permease [Bacteroidota bacterium]